MSARSCALRKSRLYLPTLKGGTVLTTLIDRCSRLLETFLPLELTVTVVVQSNAAKDRNEEGEELRMNGDR